MNQNSPSARTPFRRRRPQSEPYPDRDPRDRRQQRRIERRVYGLDLVEDRLPRRQQEEPEILEPDDQLHGDELPHDVRLAGVLHQDEDADAERAGDHGQRQHRQVDAHEAPPPVGLGASEDIAVVQRGDDRPEDGDLLRHQRRRPEPCAQDHPLRAVPDHPAPRGQQREQEEAAVQHLRPAADVPHGLGHHRMQPEQGGRHERHHLRRDAFGRPRGSVGPLIAGGAPGKLKDQQHVQHVQQDTGQMVPHQLPGPDGSIERVGEVHQGPHRLAEDDALEGAEVVDRRVPLHRPDVVVGVGVVQGIDVEQPGIESGQPGQPPVASTVQGRARDLLRRRTGGHQEATFVV